MLDGGMGTLLQKKGLLPGEATENWSITHFDDIFEVHSAYFEAGSNIVLTNTFGVNAIKYSEKQIDKFVKESLRAAKKAREKLLDKSSRFIALDIGPSGKMIKPYGDMSFEEAVSAFAPVIKAGEKYGADLIFIETFNDGYETKAAVLAAKENSNLPIFVSNAYGDNSRLLNGATPESMAVMLESLGVSAIGCNCSLGPRQLFKVLEKLSSSTTLPIIFKPNAGLPKMLKGVTSYDILPDSFSEAMLEAYKLGARVLGGCCGTTPEYIKKTSEIIEKEPFKALNNDYSCCISSRTKVLDFSFPVIIGERINPTGKKRLAQALRENDISYVLKEALSQEESGAHCLDVNVGTPGIDEPSLLKKLVEEIQAVTDLPLQIDSSDPVALEMAARVYNGRPLINSVNGKEESLSKVLPIAKKYGGVLIALTLDENGIPESPNERLNIAKKILKRATSEGLRKEDIIFDPLTLTIGTDSEAALKTINAVKSIKNNLGCKTSLGVSNVSFGLPERETISSSFFLMALSEGLSAAIINPLSKPMMKAYLSYMALSGKDKGCLEYIEYITRKITEEAPANKPQNNDSQITLRQAVEKGLKNDAERLAEKLLIDMSPMDIINKEIIPALDEIGKKYEKGQIYLPQLLLSAETSAAACEIIKTKALSAASPKKAKIVLATVKGDIHDIGKNIVKMLLENYGYEVLDLGKDVPPETILETTLRSNAPCVGLSALMTTTLPSMKETVALLKKNVPSIKIMVGGAVLTKEYAEEIGADFYAEDAMESVRYAESNL